jgi:hypothetical protein
VLRRMPAHQVAILVRELAFEAFHRGIPRWRVLLDIADELHGQAERRARNMITRRLARTDERVA